MQDSVEGSLREIEKKRIASVAPARSGAVRLDHDLAARFDAMSLDEVIALKVARFFEQAAPYYPENVYSVLIANMERPMLAEIMRRTGGNQVQAAKVLGINRNTLRKKIKHYRIP